MNALSGGSNHYPIAPADPRQFPGKFVAPGYEHSPFGADPFQDKEPSFDFLQILAIAISWRWLIMTLVAAGICIGLAITWTTPPKYKSIAKIEVSIKSARALQDFDVLGNPGDVLRQQNTAIQRLKSRSLLERVVFDLNLTNDTEFLFPPRPWSISNLINALLGGGGSVDLKKIPPQRLERMAIGVISSGLTLAPVRGTNIVSVSFSSGNAEKSAKIANQIVASYLDQQVDRGSATSNTVRKFITEQVEQVKERLQTSEKALLSYAKKANITTTGDETSLISGNIKSINESLAKVIQDRLQFDRRAEQIKKGRASSLPSVVESEALSNLQSKTSELQAEYREKLATFKPNFPVMKSLRGQINEMRAQERRLIRSIGESVLVKHEGIIANEKDLRNKLEEMEVQQRDYQDKKVQYTILKREVDSFRTQYDALIGKLNEVGIGADLRSTNAEIIESAIAASGPHSPRLLVNLLVALVLSSALAGAVIYLLEMLDNSISSPDQVENILKVALLGIIPRVDDKDLKEELEHSTSAISEAYRSLRTSLQFTGSNGAPKTLLVTSAEPSEGKSTTAKKVASEFGAIGARVLIIDCDLRKPNLHRLFGCDNLVGLSNILTGTLRKDDANDVFRKTNLPNVTLITSGSVPPNPADLLISGRMDTLFKLAINRFDMIILDAPPVIGLSDAPILSNKVEGTILAISHNFVSRKSCLNAIKRLRAAGANIVGACLTRFDSGKLNVDSSYKYMAYNYYTYGDENLPLIASEGVSNETSDEKNYSVRSSLRRLYNWLSSHSDKSS